MTASVSIAARSVKPERPSWAVYKDPVRVDKRILAPGVYHHSTRSNLNQDEWLSSPVWVSTRVISADDGSHGRILQYATNSGIQELLMPMELLAGTGEEIRRELLRRGAKVSTETRARTLFTAYLMHEAPDKTIMTTSHIGWQSPSVFVLPSAVIGRADIHYSGSGPSPFSTSGTLAAWQEQVAAICLSNPLLILGVSIALAGPLLRIAQIHGGGVHLVGKSSTGKTLAQLVAGSVWGNPSSTGFVCSWDASRVGVETVATARNDTLLCLDEIGRVDPADIEKIVYALANGQGRATMARDRSANPVKTWRLLTFSSGEKSLAEHAALSGAPAHAGAELRMIDVSADRSYGVFDALHDFETSSQLHRHLSDAIHEHHGLLGIEFLRHLVDESEAEIRLRFQAVRQHFDAPSAQAGRIADRFSLIATAGELATQFGVLPWPQGTALAAMRQLFGEWLAQAGSGESEDRRVLQQIIDFLGRHRNRFPDLRAGVHVPHQAGWVQQTNDGASLYLFSRSSLSEACPGLGIDRVVKILNEHGVIASHDRDRLTKKTRLPDGSNANLYVLNPASLL